MERQPPQILTINSHDVEAIELNLVIMPAGVQAGEVRDAVDPEEHRLTIDEELVRFRSAASTIRGYRSVQSWAVAGEQAHALSH
jgi:hypothetical protein